MRDEVVLIGPLGAGKTTVAALLGQALGLPVVALDDVRWNYYAEVGYDADEAAMREAREGFIAKYQYWKPFEIHAVERVLAEHSDCVIEFGAGHSVYEDDAMFERARRGEGPAQPTLHRAPLELRPGDPHGVHRGADADGHLPRDPRPPRSGVRGPRAEMKLRGHSGTRHEGANAPVPTPDAGRRRTTGCAADRGLRS